MLLEFLSKVEEIRCLFKNDSSELSQDNYEILKIKYLGRNGLVSSLMKKLGGVSKEDKPKCGKEINVLKIEIDTWNLKATL